MQKAEYIYIVFFLFFFFNNGPKNSKVRILNLDVYTKRKEFKYVHILFLIDSLYLILVFRFVF